MPSGTIKWFNAAKGFGVIAQDDGEPDLFCHESALAAVAAPGREAGAKVSYEVVEEAIGPSARAVVRR